MKSKIHLSNIVPEDTTPNRLDVYLSQVHSEYSRGRWQSWIKANAITVNDQLATKANLKIQPGDRISCDITLDEQTDWHAQALPLDVIYEDDALLIINKAADCVVHPAAGHIENTLVNALLHHLPSLKLLPRCGIIHRLDKDTTGLMVVPKTLEAHAKLVETLQAREIERHYVAIVYGEVISGSTIDKPMGRHTKNRLKQAITANGKEAITHYRIREKMQGFTELNLKLETGRTHQIRVHLTSIGFPIVGDPLYNTRSALPKGVSADKQAAVKAFKRQALHALKLGLEHPISGKRLEFEVPPPADYIALLNALR